MTLFGYPDTGCEHSASCLNCELVACIHDVPMVEQIRIRNAQVDVERANAVLVAEQTMTKRDAVIYVAELYDINPRTVWRILRRVNAR